MGEVEAYHLGLGKFWEFLFQNPWIRWFTGENGNLYLFMFRAGGLSQVLLGQCLCGDYIGVPITSGCWPHRGADHIGVPTTLDAWCMPIKQPCYMMSKMFCQNYDELTYCVTHIPDYDEYVMQNTKARKARSPQCMWSSFEQLILRTLKSCFCTLFCTENYFAQRDEISCTMHNFHY